MKIYLFSLFAWVLILSPKTQARSCGAHLFSSQNMFDKIIDSVGLLEARLQSELQNPTFNKHKNPKVEEQYLKVHEFIQELLNHNMNPSIKEVYDLMVKFNEIKSIRPKLEEETLSDWQSLIQNPHTIKADTPYTVEQHSGKTIQVQFKEEIIEKFFISKDPKIKLAGEKFLKAIQKGHAQSAHGDNGIKSFSMASSVYEVKIMGHPYRLGGYFHKNTFYIVFLTEDSNHGGHRYTQNFVDSVTRTRHANGH